MALQFQPWYVGNELEGRDGNDYGDEDALAALAGKYGAGGSQIPGAGPPGAGSPFPTRIDPRDVQYVSGPLAEKQAAQDRVDRRDDRTTQNETARVNMEHAKTMAALQEKGLTMDANGNITPIPNAASTMDPSLHGDEALAKLPPNVASRVKQLLDGRSMLTAREKGQPSGQQLMDAANQVDPTFDEAASKARFAARQQFTGMGKGALSVQAAERFASHGNDLYAASQDLGGPNLGWAPLSNAVNGAERSFQQAKVARYNALLSPISGELQKLTKNGTATVDETRHIMEGLAAGQPEDVRNAAIKEFIRIGAAQMQPLREAWQSAWDGTTAPKMPMDFSPTTTAIFDNIEADRPALKIDRNGVIANGSGSSSDDSHTVGAFDQVPDGAQIAGEDIKGWRFAPNTASGILGYIAQPNSTPEGYAAMVADQAVREGHLKPEQRDDYYQRTLEPARDYFSKIPPGERAKVQGLDYSQIDKSATDNAGLGASLLQGFKNLPESGAQLIQGLTALPADTAASVLEGKRLGSFKATTDLAGDVANLATGGHGGPTSKALLQMLSDRYGSLGALKRTAISDPVGLAGDASLLLSGGGSAAARVGGTVGKLGEATADIGRAMDPMALVAKGMESLPSGYRAAVERAPGPMDGLQNLPSDIVGLPSGVGGAAVREATGAGYDAGRAGAGTAGSDAFIANMRDPRQNVNNVVTQAQQAVGNLRNQASLDYQAKMAQFGKDPVPLDLSQVQTAMQGLKPTSYDTMAGAPVRPSDHLAWQQMNDAVEHYAGQAAQNPELAMPMAVDGLKQDLYSIGSKIKGQYDRDAGRIAGGAYGAVKDLLVNHDPIYADTMKNYEAAANEARQIERTFSLADGKQGVNIDAATRKLQSIMRDGANANYGQRAELGDRLAELDPAGTILPSLAGQQMSSWKPRGLQSGAALLSAAGAAATNPATLPALAAFSPRAMGELAYGAGKGAGATARYAAPAMDATINGLLKAYGLYKDNPTASLALADAGDKARELDQRELLDRYGLGAPIPSLDDIAQGYSR